jgi:outer membrane protein assembly factor BamB
MVMVMVTTFGLAAVVLTVPATSAAGQGPGGPASTSSTCPDLAHHEDAARDGYNCSTLSPDATMRWSVTLNDDVSYPVIADGRVIVTTVDPGGSNGGSLYALSATTGRVLWGPIALGGGYYFPLAAASGRVFVNDFNGTVEAFDAATGDELWSATTAYFSSEPVAVAGTVWVEGPGQVYGLSEATGQIEVESAAVDGDGADPAVNSSGVFVSTGCAMQAKLSLAGLADWRDTTDCTGGGGGATALWRGAMYGGDGGVVVAQSTGTLIAPFFGVPAFSGPSVFLGDGDGVFAEDTARANRPEWTTHLPAEVVAGPVATPDAVWVATADSRLYALNPTTGAVVAIRTLPGVPGGGVEYSRTPSDIGVGDGVLIAPTGATVTAFS